MWQPSKVTGTFVIKIEKEITFDDKFITEDQAQDTMALALKKTIRQILADNQLEAEVKGFKEF